MIKILKNLLDLLPKGDKTKLVFLFIMMLFGALLEVVGIGMIPIFVSIIAAPNTVLEIKILEPVWITLDINDDGDLLVYGSIFLILLYILKNTYIIFYKYTQARFIWRRFAMIGSNLFKRYMSAPYEFHLTRNSSELLRNVTQEAQFIAQNIMTPFLKLAMDIVLITGIFTLLLWVEPIITIGVFILLGGAGGLFLKLIKEKTRSYGKMAQHDRGLMILSVNEGLGGFKDARVLNRENWFSQRFKTHIERYAKSQTFREASALTTKPVIETIAVSGMLFIGLILFWQGRGLDSIIPILTLFGAATIRLMPAIQDSVRSYTDLRYYSYVVEPIYNDTIRLQAEMHKSNENRHNNINNDKYFCLSKEIRFENVSYMYPGSETVAVEELSFAIPKGHAVGFVGASGAGKTTVVDLLLGLLTPQQGKITVDGKDILKQLSKWQNNIGYIPQFIYLADDTIRQNIAFGLPKERIDEIKLEKALQAAQLTDLIESLNDGVETVIGEHGIRLSGGQRQRIGIARALYHNPQVLIMDEATSALDNVTEKYVIEAIERLKGERTIIMIAHRLTTVRGCDTLFLMKEGKIDIAGNYETLNKYSLNFKKLNI